MWNFCIVMITPTLINRIGSYTYIIFTLLLAAFVPMYVSPLTHFNLPPTSDARTTTHQHRPNLFCSVYFCYPETSNLSLEEIDNLFLPQEHKVRANSITNAEILPEDPEKHIGVLHTEKNL